MAPTASGWLGTDCEYEQSLYADVEKVKDTRVKISITAKNQPLLKPLSQVEAFDALLVHIGRADEGDFERELQPLSLRLTTNRDDPAMCGGFRIGSFIPDPALDSDENFGIAKAWLKDCEESHCHCGAGKVPELPARIIDVGDPKGSEIPRLVLPRGAAGRYVILSHCWGGKVEPLLLKETLGSFLKGIPYKKLASNFQNAIEITRRLGIRYLWIDCLCIIQNCRDDWRLESAKMGLYYTNATLAICASASPKSSASILYPKNGGIIGEPSPVTIGLYPGDVLGTQVQVSAVNTTKEESLSEIANRAPLSSRGWAFQEMILAPRKLFFGSQSIHWGCVEGFQSADGTPTTSQLRFPMHCQAFRSVLHLSEKTITKDDFLKDYYGAVAMYSWMQLTFAADKFPAFSGVIQQVHQSIDDTYLAGLWKSDIIRGLLWNKAMQCCSHVKQYRAPSWSWAVTDDPILFSVTEPLPSSQRGLRLLDADVLVKMKGNPYGEIESARLVVDGLMMPLVRFLPEQPVESGNPISDIGLCKFDEDYQTAGVDEGLAVNHDSLYPAQTYGVQGEGHLIACPLFGEKPSKLESSMSGSEDGEYHLLLAHINDSGERSHAKYGYCLILRSARSAQDGTPEFRRAGLAWLSEPELGSLDTWKRRRIHLI